MRAYYPQSSLGECLASWITDRRHVLVALEGYFDGSNSGAGWTKSSAVTLAGFAADDSIWYEFDKEWRKILNDSGRRPAAPYLHMRYATKGKSPFTYKDGWNLKKVGFLITDLLMYLQTIDKSRFRQFACTVDLVAHRKLVAEGYSLPNPIRICNDHCATTALAWYGTNYPGLIHSAHYFFDKDEPFEPVFKARWSEKKDATVVVSFVDYFWSLIKTVTTADMKDKPALQAADLLAWATNRSLSTAKDKSFRDLHKAMKAIIPANWVVFRESELRWEYENRKPES